jgi:hypothetical protein
MKRREKRDSRGEKEARGWRERRMEDRGWMMDDGRWRMEEGGRRKEEGEKEGEEEEGTGGEREGSREERRTKTGIPSLIFFRTSGVDLPSGPRRQQPPPLPPPPPRGRTKRHEKKQNFGVFGELPGITPLVEKKK